MFVGQDYRLVTRDLRTIEPRTPRRMFENWALASWKLLEQLMDAISVSSSQSGRNLGAAGEAGAAVEADAIEEQQQKRTQLGSS